MPGDEAGEEPMIETLLDHNGKTLVHGHVIEALRAIPTDSVRVCVTSPPYFGLRAYGTEPQVWNGSDHCEHVWLEQTRPVQSGGTGAASKKQLSNVGSQEAKAVVLSAFCDNCGGWRGELGAEPSAELFVDHLIGVFAEVRRVLADDGTLWLNIGDSHGGSGKGPTGHNGVGDQGRRQGFVDRRSPGRPKSLHLIPERLAIGLLDDGWIVRQKIAWCKRAPMPESVRDRPTSAWEHIWMLSKQERYYYDYEAVKEAVAASTIATHAGRRGGVYTDHRKTGTAPPGRFEGDDIRHHNAGSINRNGEGRDLSGRNMWNYWVLSNDVYAKAHFATFPREIPRRAILAGSAPGDLVLDPFAGSGTTLEIAAKLGRRSYGIELNRDYCGLILERLSQDSLFVEA
jgi:DNA modification methylase